MKFLAFEQVLKNIRRGRIEKYSEKYRVPYFKHKKPWGIKCDAAFPSATQNEITFKDAQTLLDNGCYIISEGANMPAESAAVNLFIQAKILYGPAKAANAGGVATSGMEMSQNSVRELWTKEEVDKRLKKIMKKIHDSSYSAAEKYGEVGNYVLGSNIAGFVKVANAMIDQGIV